MYKLSPIIRDNKKKISRRLRRNQFLRKKFHADIKIHYATRKKSNFIEHNSFKKKKPAYSHMITRETRDGNLNIKNRNGINRWYNFIKSSIHDKLIALFSKKKKKENDIKYKS